MDTNTATEAIAANKLTEKPNESTADTDAEVKSVLMQSIDDVVASVEECEDNKSEYESVEDDGEVNSVDGNVLPVDTNTNEKKTESAEVEVKDNVEECVEETADKEIDSSEVFIDEEGGQEAFAEMNEDDEYEDIDDSEEDEELKVETIEPSAEKTCNVLEEGKTTKKGEEHEENEACVEGERQQGDGQESGDQSGNLTDDLDDDEDKRNPQYIPKRGAFYEHDDRMVATVEEVEKVPEEPVIIAKNVESSEKIVKKGKKLWSESDKWSHDLFDEDEQKPKSKEEVLSTYGYDIRNEDNAPKARRRRRYGRGPGRYTRNWQDEDAYSKVKAERKNSQSSNEKEFERPGKSKPLRDLRRPAFKKEDFPELPSNDRDARRGERNFGKERHSAWNKSRNIEKERRQLSPSVEFKTEPMKVIEAIENNRRTSIPVDPLKVEMVKTQTFENSRYTSKRGDEPSNGREKSNYTANTHVNNAEMGRPIRKTSHLQDNNKSANYNTPKGEHTERKPRNKGKYMKEDVFLDEPRNTYNQNYVSDVSAGMQKLNIDKVNRSSGEAELSQQRPKRYSSLRQQQQRSVPEGLTSPMPASTQNITVSHQQRPTPPNQFYDASPHSPGFYPETASPRSSFAYIQQNNTDAPPQPNQHPSRFMPHQISPRYLPQSAPETSEPPFMPQAVPPPTTPQTSSSHPPVLTAPAASFMTTYPPGYPQFPPPPPPPQFHSLPPQPSQAEIYRGGVTYYDPNAQQAQMRQLPQRRPKNAIPIVPPPVEM